MPTTAKVHPCLPDGWLMDAPYRAYSNTRHRGPTDRGRDGKRYRRHFDHVEYAVVMTVLL